VVSGPDNAAVTQTVARIASQVRHVPDLAHVVTNSALDRPELRFRPRPGVAAELGVSTEALSEAIRIATIGDISANLPKFNAGNRQVPVRVQLDEAARGDPRILESLKVMTAVGVAVPLVSVAAVEMGQGPSSIERFDRQRRVMITADLNGTDALARAVNAVMELPAAKEKPEGVTFKVAGDAEIMGEVFASFGLAMAAGLLMVFGVLVLLFGSFMQPVTILASLPFTIGGVIIALLVTGRPMSMPVIIGMLMLMGIVTKNAIMLVDFAIEEIARGVPRYVAIVDAGRKRARPIVMTTIAMVGGMLPSALALGSGGEFRSPMAIAVMGGLIVSTMLSLVFVPAVFIVVDDLAGFLWRGFSRFVGEAHEEPAAAKIPRVRPAAAQIEVPAEAAE
jgi:multidrug efflux pump subunit AcrB